MLAVICFEHHLVVKDVNSPIQPLDMSLHSIPIQNCTSTSIKGNIVLFHLYRREVTPASVTLACGQDEAAFSASLCRAPYVQLMHSHLEAVSVCTPDMREWGL